MVKQSVAERRRWIRAKRILSIQFRLIKPNLNNAWQLSTTQDMSVGGLSFYTDQEYHPNNILELKVVMSGVLDIFSGYAKVVRAERKRTGVYYLVAVKFVETKDKGRSAKSYIPGQKKSKKKKRL